MEELEYIRKQIMNYGFMSASKISIILNSMDKKFDDKEIKKILKLIPGDGFHKIEYTNKYVAPYRTKQLFFYNPNIKRKKVYKSNPIKDKSKNV